MELKVRAITRGLATFAAAFALAGSAQAQVNVTIYAGHSAVDGGTPYTDPIGSLTVPRIDFATSTGYDWHPFGAFDFGALMTGCLVVPTTGEYTFGTDSDDGSMFYLSGGLVVDNGDPHGPLTVFGDPVTLTAGVEYEFRLEFFEDFGGPSGVDLLMLDAAGASVIVPESFFVPCSVPEPGTVALLSAFGLTGLGLASRRRAGKK